MPEERPRSVTFEDKKIPSAPGTNKVQITANSENEMKQKVQLTKKFAKKKSIGQINAMRVNHTVIVPILCCQLTIKTSIVILMIKKILVI